MGYEKIKRNITSNELYSVNVHKRAGSTSQMQLHCQKIITITTTTTTIIINNNSNNNNNNINNSTVQYIKLLSMIQSNPV